MARILLIDDEETVRFTLAKILQREKHEVTTAANGVEAMKLVMRGKFDLVITDLVMPEKEGLETILEIRKILPELKIIAMSGGGRGSAYDYLKIASKIGADRTLTKPFSGDELREAISATLPGLGGNESGQSPVSAP
jgi:YesN/AraC family two-component response regulator